MPRTPFSLRTDRLTIRALARRDITEFTRYRNIPDIAAYQDWPLPYTRDAAHELVDELERTNGPTADQWVQLAITDDDDRLLGDLAVWLDPTGHMAMVGYTIAPEQQGNGYATEALHALLAWLFEREVHRVAATLDPDNLGSARVLERCGFRYIGTARRAAHVRGEWLDDARYELLRGDWSARRAARRTESVSLVPVDRDNVRAVLELDRGFSQRRFVSSVAQSLGEALVADEHDGRETIPWIRAIAADDELVGFMMVAEPSGDVEHPYLWRFLVDVRHQARGIGRRALLALAADWADRGATHLVLSCVAGTPGSPEPFYRSLGFTPTGAVRDGETEMIAPLAELLQS